MPGLLLDTLNGTPSGQVPLWLMRQAGRYLPEYRELRARKGGFLAMAYDSEAACEITLQPIDRFGFDGAILFSDILIVPHALGQHLEFLAGEGPKLSPKLVDSSLDALTRDPSRYEPIYETVRLCRKRLPEGVTMLGFAGSPWTVATYMVAGEGSRDQHEARALAYRDPAALQVIIDAIVDETITYLSGQIEAGAEAVQLFDSWAGSLAPDEFEKWVIAPNARIVAALAEKHPDTPVIGFPKGSGEKLPAYARETGVKAVGVDETLDPAWVARELPEGMPVQGNLDPLLLLAGSDELEKRVRTILDAFSGRPHVFNLGHGIDRRTPIEHVERLIAAVRNHAV
ncbi:uroporphyrinogen decarboxylase [Qipengyuania aquimaris]|uniref:Uroporphyrinogen decarboxylase n=1 Tax=Qipengyuania aquimaris TaxID=255984 RepID=A0A9Q3XDB1_9SPHN|nr:uroporphyrinogen decarboxylase [Qipengyuania aquimaris]MBY6127346.1 uroporphyrinogen decarboxylase [Qipengyuania aquimaris]MBY6219128.1 uroporphyrinogen decarboxylase [Qipengyuania aquimaris]